MGRRRPHFEQLTFERRLHGGSRPGAGRPLRAGSGVPHQAREISRARPLHVTTKFVKRLPSLRDSELWPHLVKCFHLAREREGFRVCHFSVQVNHVHAIVEADDRDRLARGMRGLNGRLAKCLNRRWGTRRRLVADRFHSRSLRAPRETRNAIAYVICNARKHGLEHGTERPDPFSSGPWFEHWTESWEPPVALGPAPVASPRTWLLSVGWLRHGPIPMGWRPGPA